MLRWLERRPPNVTALRGNHEEDFAWYVSILHQIDETYQLAADPRSNADSGALYDTAKYVLRAGGIGAQFFDMYGTVGRLLNDEAATLADLDAWAERLRALPLFWSRSPRSRPSPCPG